MNSNRVTKQQSHPLETTSILSDYDEDYEFVDGIDDQSSYVLFNPRRVSKASDVLSTNTSNILSAESTRSVETFTEFHNTDLSLKIDNWHDSNLVSSEIEDDNIASWDVDENIMDSEAPDVFFYGDDLLAHLDSGERAKLKRFHSVYDLKSFLLSKDPSAQNKLNSLVKSMRMSGRIESNMRCKYIEKLKKSQDSLDIGLHKSINRSISRSISGRSARSLISDGTSSLVMCEN